MKGARLLVQVDVGDTRDLARLLDVGPMSADGQAHQVVTHCKLLVKPRRQLSGTLRNETRSGGKGGKRKLQKCFILLLFHAL